VKESCCCVDAWCRSIGTIKDWPVLLVGNDGDGDGQSHGQEAATQKFIVNTQYLFLVRVHARSIPFPNLQHLYSHEQYLV
jgi:hypothetical protein